MVNQDLGRISVILRGEYDPEANYERLDCVSYQGSSYLVRKHCVGITPAAGEYYQLAALAGSSAAADAAAVVANAAAENANAAAGRADTAAGNAQAAADAVSGDVNQIKDDLSDKLPKYPTDWEVWTAEEQASARERMGLGKSIYLHPDAISEDVNSVSFDLDDTYNEFLIEIKAPTNYGNTNGYIRLNRTDSTYGSPIYHGVILQESGYKKESKNNIYARLSVFSDSLLTFSYTTTQMKSMSIRNSAISYMSDNINENYGNEETWGDDGWDKINIMVIGNVFPAGTTFIVRGWKR